jgi:hypothetical protein
MPGSYGKIHKTQACFSVRNTEKMAKKLLTPGIFCGRMVLPVKKGLYLCAFFQPRVAYVVAAFYILLLAVVIQGGKFKEVPICALKSL